MLQKARAYIVKISFRVLAELQPVLSAGAFGSYGYVRGHQSNRHQGEEVSHGVSFYLITLNFWRFS
jgi:hypothetical protein